MKPKAVRVSVTGELEQQGRDAFLVDVMLQRFYFEGWKMIKKIMFWVVGPTLSLVVSRFSSPSDFSDVFWTADEFKQIKFSKLESTRT